MGHERRFYGVCGTSAIAPTTALKRTSREVRVGPNPEVGTTRLPGSNWSSARSYLCNGDTGDCEQPTNNQPWGDMVAKEQHARNHGEHRKQQAEWCDAAHGTTGDQPEPKAKPKDSADENCVGECQPTTLIRHDKARQLSMFKELRHQRDLRHREQRRPPHQHQRVKRAVAL